MRILVIASLLILLGRPASSATLITQVASTPGARAKQLAELKAKVSGDNRKNPVASLRWTDEALQLLAAEPDPRAETWFLTQLVGDLNTLLDYQKAELVLTQARKLVARTKDERDHLLLEAEAASLFSAMDKSAEAKTLLAPLLPALVAYRSQHPDDQEIGQALGRAYRIQGRAFQVTGQFSEAFGAYLQSKKVYEATGNLRGEATVLSLIGNLYTALERNDEAEASHLQAIQMAEQLGDLSLQATFHLALASTYGPWNKPDAQLATIQQALALAARAQDTDAQFNGLVNLADAYLGKKDYRATLKAAEAALRIPGINKDPGYVAVCQINRGIALNRLGNSAEGLKAIQEGLRHVKATQSKNDIAEITGNLAEEYAFAGDYRRAYETGLEFKALSDALKLAEDKKRIAAASAAFESDKQNMQIEGLKREQRAQAYQKLFWIALGALGFTIAGVLVFSRKKLQHANDALAGLNDQNLDLIEQLQAALHEVRTLQGLIPICAHCKKIRDDQGYWNQMESYIQSRTEAQFTHGICPDCLVHVIAEFEKS